MITLTVIHLVRKPLAGTVAQNALKYGTGGLNIDGTRLACGTEHMRGYVKGMTLGGMTGADPRKGASLGRFEPGRAFQATDHPAGRWPANLVLEHHPGCRMTGIHESKGYVINRWDDGSKPFGGGAGHDYTGHQIPDMVEMWECTPECPVRGLNQQSGDCPGLSGGEALDNRKTGREVIPSYNRKPSAPFIRSDHGGASRFFKNVQRTPDFVRASGDVICDQCARTYSDHPYDFRVTDWDNHPFLRVRCDGTRLKL